MTHFRLTFVLIAFAILSSGIAVPQNQAAAKGGTISGDIQDTTLLELPISGVRVVLINADGAEFETQSDEHGHYTRADLPPGQYVVNIYKQGYQDRIGKPVSVIDEGRHYVPLTMNRLDIDENRDGLLRFQVYNHGRRGGPIEGLEIKITGTVGVEPPVVTGISDARGQYESDKLSPGNYIITLIKDDYYAIYQMTVHADKITKAFVQFPMPDENTEPSPPNAQESESSHAKNVIRGKIREMIPADIPLSDVKVVIESPNGIIVFSDMSNADGEYECRGLSAGSYFISLHKDGYIEKKGIPIIVENDRNHRIGIIEEKMFVSYGVVANGSLLELTHGMRK